MPRPPTCSTSPWQSIRLAVSLKAVAKAAYNRDRGWGVIHAAFPGISPAE